MPDGSGGSQDEGSINTDFGLSLKLERDSKRMFQASLQLLGARFEAGHPNLWMADDPRAIAQWQEKADTQTWDAEPAMCPWNLSYGVTNR
jgi:hypothetical protein